MSDVIYLIPKTKRRALSKPVWTVFTVGGHPYFHWFGRKLMAADVQTIADLVVMPRKELEEIVAPHSDTGLMKSVETRLRNMGVPHGGAIPWYKTQRRAPKLKR